MIEEILRRDRQVVACVLVCVTAICWWYLLAGAGTGMYPHEMAVLIPARMSMDMSMSAATWTPGYAVLMFFMWWLMMVAMMLPGAAPMVLLHAALTRKGMEHCDNAGSTTGSHGLLAVTIAFIAGYLVIWGAFSLAAVIAQWGLERGELLSAMMTPTSRLLGAGLLLAAGVWQLTPLKTVCLHHCRSPVSFLSAHWRPGVGGAFAMGLQHGGICLGCCWFLMALLFYGGVMNLVWIVGLALFVLVEKVVPAGVALGRVTGLLLIAWAVWLGFTAL